MIKESKYIIRKIIIGVGIALCLAFLNGCKVKAYNSPTLPYDSLNNDISFYQNNNSYEELFRTNYNNNIGIFYKSTENNAMIYYASNVCSVSINLYDIDSDYSNLLGLINGNNSDGLRIYTNNSLDNVIYIYYNNVSYLNMYVSNKENYNNLASFHIQPVAPEIRNNQCYISYYSNNLNANQSDSYSLFSQTNITLNNFVALNGMNIYNYYDESEILKEPNIISSDPYPVFVSWNQTPISTNNLILSYNLAPEFSLFNTDNFVYQYKFGENSTTWLSLTENKQNIRINSNGSIYVRIKDLANNNVIDSATFTISDIGQFYNPNIDYKITFNGEYRTENFLNDNVSSSPSVIKEYIINVDYSPKSSILTYQYQYVSENSSLDSNNWQTLGSSNNGSFGYVASQNGILYARILDNENNVLTTSTFTVNAIGKLALDSYNPQFENFFTKLSNKIDYGGPISAIFRLPVNFLSKFYDKAKVNTCTPYRLSQLLGVDFYLPCIDLKSYIGNTYYHMFDIMLCIIFTLNLIKFLYTIYNKFVSLEEVD